MDNLQNANSHPILWSPPLLMLIFFGKKGARVAHMRVTTATVGKSRKASSTQHGGPTEIHTCHWEGPSGTYISHWGQDFFALKSHSPRVETNWEKPPWHMTWRSHRDTHLPSRRSMRGRRIMSDSCWMLLRWEGWLSDTWPWPLTLASSWPSSWMLDLIWASRLQWERAERFERFWFWAFSHNNSTRTELAGLLSAQMNVEFLRALGRQSGVSVWQHTLVG